MSYRGVIRDLVYQFILKLSRVFPVLKVLLRSQRVTTVDLPNNPGFNWHENFITHLSAVLKPKVYVELGLYHCELFNRVVPFAEKLIGVDISPDAGDFMIKSSKTEFACLSTDEFAKEAKKRRLKIDLLFIDANHSKESVKRDFESFFPLISDQGIILLHDGFPKDRSFTNPGFCGDGYKAIEELTRNARGYEMVTIPLPPGLTICRKRSKHVPWEKP